VVRYSYGVLQYRGRTRSRHERGARGRRTERQEERPSGMSMIPILAGGGAPGGDNGDSSIYDMQHGVGRVSSVHRQQYCTYGYVCK
jgi:hypothetical protein